MSIPYIQPQAMIEVVNKKNHEPTSHDFYIGRGSVLGNRYSSKPSSKNYVERVDSREKAIEKFSEWLKNQIKSENEKVVLKLYEILLHEKKYGQVNLVCYCKPKACHGDALKSFLEKAKSKLNI